MSAVAPRVGELYQRAYGVLWEITHVDMFGIDYLAVGLNSAGCIGWKQWNRLKLKRVER